jgi:CRISPR-associated protein Cmr2
MQRLRDAYSGKGDENKNWEDVVRRGGGLVSKEGFASLDGRLMRMMGERATASCGAVIAHHQAPLAAVLRELRTAEKRAKSEGGRDAFSLTIIKRSGGALYLTDKWGEPLETLRKLIDFLRMEKVSRRAVYHTLEWLKDLPDDVPDLLEKMLAYQLNRQAGGDQVAKKMAEKMAEKLTQLTGRAPVKERKKWLANFLSVAEFLARETRATPISAEGAEA